MGTEYNDSEQNSSTEDVEILDAISIIEDLEDYEEVSAALIKLSTLNKDKMVDLGCNILNRELGDKYLQGMTFSLIYSINPRKAIEVISSKVYDINPILLRDIMEELATDCFQDFAREIPDKLLREIQARYLRLSKVDREYIIDEYRRFVEAYNDRI